MSTVPEQIQQIRQLALSNLSLINGTRNTGILYTYLGDVNMYGCKVSILTSTTFDFNDDDHVNPHKQTPALRPEEYPNAALVYGEGFLLENTTGSIDSTTLPSATYSRYDIVYIYVGDNGSTIATATGTSTTGTPTDPAIPVGALQVARLIIDDTGITSVVDLRDFNGQLQGDSITWGGDWVTSTVYVPLTLLIDSATGNMYITVNGFTSSASVATDVSNGDLELLIDVSASTSAAAASAAAALVSENAAAASASAALSSENGAAADLALTNADVVQTGLDVVAAQLAADNAAAAANYQGVWSAGTYTLGESVSNGGAYWVVNIASTTEEPSSTSTDWNLLNYYDYGLPTINPTLNLDFANTANNDGTIDLDPRVTFERATTATTIDSRGRVVDIASGEPRVLYESGVCKGLLVEEQRTSYTKYPRLFTESDWTKSNVSVIPYYDTAPDGSITSCKVTSSAANGTITQGITTTAVDWTASFYLKRITGTGNIDISMDGSTWVTQTLTSDWQRFSVTQTGIAGTSNHGIRIVTSGDEVAVWHGQAE